MRLGALTDSHSHCLQNMWQLTSMQPQFEGYCHLLRKKKKKEEKALLLKSTIIQANKSPDFNNQVINTEDPILITCEFWVC